MPLMNFLNAITGGAVCGLLCWLLLSAAVRVAPLLRLRNAFRDLVLNISAEQARANLHRAGREALLLTAGACAAAGGFVALWLLAVPRFRDVTMWVLFGVACVVIVAWSVFTLRAWRHWRDCRFAARADAALGAALDRLAMQGHRVFHAVTLGKQCFEHVIVGSRGLFVVRTVARRPGRMNAARLNDRTLEFHDGKLLVDPILEAEQGARMLSELASRQLGHALRVRAVVAVPGWEVTPDQVGELLLINEKTAVLLLSWSRPVDQPLEGDDLAMQERLARMSINHGW